MPLLEVSGVRVNFPFEPYPCQVTYMEKVVKCLQENVNGVLESPTGTGKTLCLLCSTLAWQESRKAQAEFNRQVNVTNLMGDSSNLQASSLEKLSQSLHKATGTTWGGSEFSVPKIIYASRTHSQLSQAIQELKRTAYNSVKVSIIGSREQLCIHEQVKKEQNNTSKVHMCRAKVNARTCYYYNHLDDLKKNSEARVLMGNVVDIEDMIGYGQKNKVCPYYMARELKTDADIIFMPYNYLLDPKTRKAHGVELQGNVVIFDEAHNLEKICEESSSFDLKPGDLATAIEEVVRLSEKFVQMITAEQQSEVEYSESSMPEPDFNLDDLLRLKATLKDVEDQIDQITVPANGKGITKPGVFIFELLAKASIVFENKSLLIELLDKVVGYITNDATGAGSAVTKGVGLSKFADILKIIFSQDVLVGSSVIGHQKEMAKYYKVHIQPADTGKKKKQMDLWTEPGAPEKTGKTLSYWCFSPGHSMAELVGHGVKCILLTSGTLSPISSFTAEMQIPFPVQLENPHVIERHQVWVGTLRKGPDGTTLNSNYETRFTPSYQASLGNAVVNFARVVPNGLLIFFPSYPVMEKSLEFWKEKNIYTRIEQYKQIFVEPRAKGVLNDVMEDFYTKINDPALNGAIFIAVCRGKVSEGLDFSDINGRAVMITGLPYPPYLDPKVVLKMQFLDEMKGKQGFKSLSGKEWYKQQASRAVNQAIGRVIRHKQDFGAIVLCDTRFSAPDALKQLPVWVKPYVNKYENFGLAIKDAMMFFKTAEKMMPAAQPTRKKGTSGQPQGAYFQPTVTRGREPDGFQHASSVAQHVPSLKAKPADTVNVAQLREQYHSSGAGVATSQRGSFFSALEQAESMSLIDRFSASQESCSGTGSKVDVIPGSDRRPAGKKKIIIKKRDSISPTETAVVTEAVSSQHIFTAESYVAEIKKTLGTDGYKVFSKALVEYKKTEDLHQVVNTLTNLFIGDTGHHHLLKKFYKFVRPKHKTEFEKMYRELTGEATGYQPHEAISKKRLLQETESGMMKKARLSQGQVSMATENTDTKDCKANGKTNTACGQMVSGCQNSLLGGCGNFMKTTLVCSASTNDNETDSIAELPLSRENTSAQTLCDTTSGVTGLETSRATGPLALKYPKPLTQSGHLCCLCGKDARTPFQSTCDHVCCMSCWRQVFEGDKLCPRCRKRVRRRYLTRLQFRGSETEDQSLSTTDDRSPSTPDTVS